MRAYNRRDWETVVRALNTAIAWKPDHKGSVGVNGPLPEAYIPHFYMAWALANHGDCEAAKQEYDEAVRQGAISRREELRLRDETLRCLGRQWR
jgi:hypothetical protein